MQLGQTNTAAVSQFGSGWMHRDRPVSLHRRSSIMRSTDLRRRCSLSARLMCRENWGRKIATVSGN